MVFRGLLLNDLIKQMKGRQILFNINDLPLNTAAEINIARRRLENILSLLLLLKGY